MNPMSTMSVFPVTFMLMMKSMAHDARNMLMRMMVAQMSPVGFSRAKT